MMLPQTIRSILAVVSGVVAWFVIATAVNLTLRFAWPRYAAVEAAMAFTPSMLLLRLAIGFLSSIVAAVVASIVSRSRYVGVAGLSAVLLVLFAPVHLQVWDRFPVWYHVTFLASLVIVPLLVDSALTRIRPES